MVNKLGQEILPDPLLRNTLLFIKKYKPIDDRPDLCYNNIDKIIQRSGAVQ